MTLSSGKRETSNASSALCHASCGFVVNGNSVAMLFLFVVSGNTAFRLVGQLARL